MTTGSNSPNSRSSTGKTTPDIMQEMNRLLARLTQTIQRQIQATGNPSTTGQTANTGPNMMPGHTQQAQSAAATSRQQISASAAPAGAGFGQSAPAGAGGAGIMGRLGGMARSGYGLMGGHLGMGIMAASMILPAMMAGGQGGGGGQQNQVAAMERDANRASNALARLNLNLRMTAAATGTSSGGILSTATMYTSAGVQDGLGMARNMAAQQSAYAAQIAVGAPNYSAMTGYAVLGMDPMAPTNMRPEQLQNAIVDQLRGMSPEQRGGHRTRGALMQTGLTQEQIGALLAQANLSQQDREYNLRMQGWVQRAQDSPENEVLTRRQQNIAEINAYAQARQHNVDMTKAYLKAGGSEEPVFAAVKDQITEQWQRAQIQFWLSMIPMLERLRDLFQNVVQPGGPIETFGDVVARMSDLFARSLSIAVGAALMFAGGVGQIVNVGGTGAEILGHINEMDLSEIGPAFQAGQRRHKFAGRMMSTGQQIIMDSLTVDSYNPDEIDRLMGMHNNPGAPYMQNQVVVEGVPVNQIESKGRRQGEQTGRILDFITSGNPLNVTPFLRP